VFARARTLPGQNRTQANCKGACTRPARLSVPLKPACCCNHCLHCSLHGICKSDLRPCATTCIYDNLLDRLPMRSCGGEVRGFGEGGFMQRGVGALLPKALRVPPHCLIQCVRLASERTRQPQLNERREGLRAIELSIANNASS
jgi:hypothetical protein